MSIKDPSRDPELTSHYVSHALLLSRLNLDEKRPRLEKVRGI